MLSRRALPTFNNILRTLTRTRHASSSASSSSPATPSTTTTNSSNVTVQQSHNYPTTWSTNQKPRPGPGSGPRFEQTDMNLQPNPPSAMAMIAEEPIRIVQGRRAVCDGGGGPLGHPKIYLNLDQPGPRACGYCGIRFQQDPHHHH